jgi:hypothetical protein
MPILDNYHTVETIYGYKGATMTIPLVKLGLRKKAFTRLA